MTRATARDHGFVDVDDPTWREVGKQLRAALSGWRDGLPATAHMHLTLASTAMQEVREALWAEERENRTAEAGGA